MATTGGTEEPPGRSSRLHLENAKLKSANRAASRTSTSGSKVKDDVLLPATATATTTPTAAFNSTLENDEMLAPTPTNNSNPTLENDMMVPTPSKTSTYALELEGGALATGH
jgi:hypothetical protein